MKPQNELALIVAYYLSRLDKEAYAQLGFKTFNQAAREIGGNLDVKPSTVKNMRDEFDYHLQNSRIGWRRELRGSRLKVLQTFQMTEDGELLEIVKEILENREWTHTESYQDIHALLRESEKKLGNRSFILRGPTGRSAEDYFIQAFGTRPIPAKGELVDCRDMGCGYDFKIIVSEEKSIYVEVKGLASNDGGILFTDKEWRVARQRGEDYYLVLIKNVSISPEITVMQNPSSKMKPKRNIHTTIQVSWSVSNKALREHG
jgi:hypothetical protein